MTIETLNALPASSADAELLRCCASQRWAAAMTAARPFHSEDALLATAERIWWSLEAADWLEAFAAHPRIGERSSSGWSTQEQAAASTTSDAVRAGLADGNQRYEQRFGYTFIVCATGRSAEQLLMVLERRMAGTAADELQIAATEQRKITALRLEKLLHS